MTLEAPAAFDVFLSHNSRDKPLVERLALELRDCGFEPWLDKWYVTPGGRWQDDLAAGLRASKSCAVFVGPHDVGSWEQEEVGVALDYAAKNRGFRVFLVLLPGVAEPFDPSTLSPFLSTRTWVDLRRGVDRQSSVQALVNAVKGVPLAPPVAVEIADAVCPYRGLQPFDEEHASFYFGRDAEIQRLVEQLKSSSFLAVLGPSGSGKSSLVRAGLLPAIRDNVLPESAEWPIRVFTPGADPLTQLAAQVSRLGECGSMASVVDSMATDPRGLHLATALALGDRPVRTKVVWVVDQFEEIFTLCSNEAGRTQFIANLLNAAAPSGRALVVVTLRADFYHRCAAYPDLAAIVAAKQFLVSPMDGEGLRQAIEEPARLAGLEFEEGLVDTIVEDVGSEPAALPLLEHSLLELWERRRIRMLTLEGYRASGGLQGAIAQRAESTYAELDPEGRAASRRVLLRLTQIGVGSEDTRRRAAVSELVTRSQEAARIEDVIRRWTGARLLTMSAGDDGERWVTVAHEALIRAWPRLRGWIDEDRAGQRLHRQITEAAREWRTHEQDKSWLLRGVRLAQAVEFRTGHEDSLNEDERRFIDASVELTRQEEAQRERRRRHVLFGLSAGILIALGLAGAAGWQWRRADAEQRRSTVRALTSRADLVRSHAQAIAPGWPDFLTQSGLLAIEARRREADLSTALGLRAAADVLPTSVRQLATPLNLDEAVPGFSAARDEIAVASPDRRSVRLIALSSGDTIATLTVGGNAKHFIYGPRGNFLAIFTDAEVEVWSLAGTPQRLWAKPAGPFSGLAEMFPGAFSPNEGTLAWIAGPVVIVADVRSGDELRRIQHNDDVSQVVFSGNGLKLASGGGDSVQVLTLVNGAIQKITLKHKVFGVSLDERGRILASVGGRVVDVWDADTGGQISQFVAFPGDDDVEYVMTITLDSTGSRVGVIGEYGTGAQFSVATGQKLWDLNCAGDSRRVLSFSPPFVAAKTQPGVELWDTTEGRPEARVLHQPALDQVVGAYFSAATDRLVLLDENRVWAYDTKPGSEAARIVVDPREALARSADRRLLALQDGPSVVVAEAAGNRQIGRFPFPAVTTSAFSRDGALLFMEARSRAAAIVRLSDRQEIWRRSAMAAAAMSPDGRSAGAAEGETLIVWELPSGKERWRQSGIPDKITVTDDEGDDVVVRNVQRIVFDAQGERVAIEFRRGAARGWMLAGGTELPVTEAAALLRLPTGTVGLAAVSNDGRWRADAKDAEVKITDAGSKRDVATVRHDGDPSDRANSVRDLEFSADGRYLVTGSSDKTVRIWDTSGRELTRISAGAAVTAVAFSADAQRVTALSDDGLVRTWIWQDNSLMNVVCERLTRNLAPGEWRTHFGTERYRLTCDKLPKPEEIAR